ncbi:MAG: FAD/NAD(P)-binding protein [bacterium]
MLPRPFRVTQARRETADTFTLQLVADDGAERKTGRRKARARFPFSPGQFNMMYAFGIGEVPISISGDPAHAEVLTHTLRAVGAVSRALASKKRGDIVGIRGPYGSHWPVEGAVGHDVVIVAGGVGLPPLRPAIYEICARRERYGHVSVLYGARRPGDVLFAKEMSALCAEHEIAWALTVDRGDAAWKGRVGVVTTLIPAARFDPRHTIAMVCGPEVMTRFTVLELRKRNVADRSIHVSLERNMKCAIGFCGHCQFGPEFICKDGPVFPFSRIAPFFYRSEV